MLRAYLTDSAEYAILISFGLLVYLLLSLLAVWLGELATGKKLLSFFWRGEKTQKETSGFCEVKVCNGFLLCLAEFARSSFSWI